MPKGFIRLNSLFENNMNMPLLSTVLVKVAATTVNGLTSTFEFSIDLSQILANYYSSFAFNNNVNI